MSKIFTISDAVSSLLPNAEWSMINHDYDTLEINTTKPSLASLNAEVTRLQADYDSKEYQRQREIAYPSIQQQLDMQYWDKINGTTNWEDAIQAVKDEYPKP